MRSELRGFLAVSVSSRSRYTLVGDTRVTSKDIVGYAILITPSCVTSAAYFWWRFRKAQGTPVGKKHYAISIIILVLGPIVTLYALSLMPSGPPPGSLLRQARAG